MSVMPEHDDLSSLLAARAELDRRIERAQQEPQEVRVHVDVRVPVTGMLGGFQSALMLRRQMRRAILASLLGLHGR